MKKLLSKISIEKIGFILILISIIMLSVCIGSNIKQPVWIIQAIISTFASIYLVISKIQKKKNIIIKSKIDIFVLLFMISTIIPLILKTYASLEGTCNFILKYWSVFGLYILTRNIIKEKKQIKIIINTIIISSIISIIFGIDKYTVNILKPILEFIEAVDIEDLRMISTFGYANTFAAYLAFTTSLAVAQFFIIERKRKILYAIYILITGIIILLTQSKTVLALIAVSVLILLVIAIKNKKISEKVIKGIIIAIIIFLLYFIIAIHIDEPIKVEQEEKVVVVRQIEGNKEYEFELDVTGKTEKEYDVFEISIVEVNRYFSEKILLRKTFGEYDGTKILKVRTNEEADHIKIKIKNRLNQELTISEIRINGEKYIDEYKFIPGDFVRIFTNFNLKYASVWQRGDYWLDGIQILQKNWLIGAGGNTWRMLYGQVQDYLYYAKEVHCYILEVWMSFGILGIASYLSIIVITIINIKKLLKNKQEVSEKINILAIVIGIGIITIHCVVDFDMSFLIIEMIFYMLIAILNKDDKEIPKSIKICDIIITLMFICISIGNLLGLTAKLFEEKNVMISSKVAPWISIYQYDRIINIENNKIEDSNKMKYLKQYIQNEPYQHQNTIYKIMCNEILKNPNKEEMNYLISTWRNVEIERKYEIEQIRKRAEVMLYFAKELKEQEEKEIAHQILELIKEEYNENNSIILDYKRNTISETMTKFEHKYYTQTYDEAVKLLENQE